jgi:hypothetical protein
MHTLKGALVAVSADNLASQAIGGYKGLQSAFRKCRQCMATSDTMQTKVRFDANSIKCLCDIFNVTHVLCTYIVHVQCTCSSPMKNLLLEQLHSMRKSVLL